MYPLQSFDTASALAWCLARGAAPDPARDGVVIVKRNAAGSIELSYKAPGQEALQPLQHGDTMGDIVADRKFVWLVREGAESRCLCLYAVETHKTSFKRHKLVGVEVSNKTERIEGSPRFVGGIPRLEIPEEKHLLPNDFEETFGYSLSRSTVMDAAAAYSSTIQQWTLCSSRKDGHVSPLRALEAIADGAFDDFDLDAAYRATAAFRAAMLQAPAGRSSSGLEPAVPVPAAVAAALGPAAAADHGAAASDHTANVSRLGNGLLAAESAGVVNNMAATVERLPQKLQVAQDDVEMKANAFKLLVEAQDQEKDDTVMQLFPSRDGTEAAEEWPAGPAVVAPPPAPVGPGAEQLPAPAPPAPVVVAPPPAPAPVAVQPPASTSAAAGGPRSPANVSVSAALSASSSEVPAALQQLLLQQLVRPPVSFFDGSHTIDGVRAAVSGAAGTVELLSRMALGAAAAAGATLPLVTLNALTSAQHELRKLDQMLYSASWQVHTGALAGPPSMAAAAAAPPAAVAEAASSSASHPLPAAALAGRKRPRAEGDTTAAAEAEVGRR